MSPWPCVIRPARPAAPLPARRPRSGRRAPAAGSSRRRRCARRTVRTSRCRLARRAFREQRRDGWRPRRYEPGRGPAVVVLAPAGPQFGEVHRAQEGLAQGQRQGLEARQHVLVAARVAILDAQPVGQLALSMDHLAGLAGQGLAGHGAIGRVQVALAQRVVVGTGRAGARRDRDIRARPLVAAQRRADADDAGAVFLHQVAARHHVQQAGARHLTSAYQMSRPACSSETSDGPLCRNTPPRPAMSRPASAWTGAAARSQLRMLRLVCGRYCTDMPCSGRPGRPAPHRSGSVPLLPRARIGRPACPARRRTADARPWSARRPVRARYRRTVDAVVVRAALQAAGQVIPGIGRHERRGQRRVRTGHADRRAAAIDGLLRQEAQLAAGRGRQQQTADRRAAGRTALGGTAVVDLPRPPSRAGWTDTRSRRPPDHGSRAGGLMAQRGIRRDIAARAQQIDGGRRRPQREPALAAAPDRPWPGAWMEVLRTRTRPASDTPDSTRSPMVSR